MSCRSGARRDTGGSPVGRTLAVDFGTKRLGFAVSDDLGLTTRPLETWTCRDRDRDLERIHEHVRDLEVCRVVVGRPVQLDGTFTPATERADAFRAELAQQLEVPVLAHDEALTSFEADARMADDHVPRSRRKALRDAYAALVLLEDFLGHEGA